MRYRFALLAVIVLAIACGQATAADIALRYDLTGDQYQRAFNEMTGQGYLPVHVDAYASPGGIRYAAIWQKPDGGRPPFIARHRISAAEYQAQFDKATADGFRLTDMSVADGGIYAGIWQKIGGEAWEARTGLSLTDFGAKLNQMAGDGFRLIDIDAYQDRGATRFAGIWTKNDGRASYAWYNLTSAQYQAKMNEMIAKGFQPVRVNGYDTPAGPRLAAIFEAASGDSIARHDMTSSDYERNAEAFRAEGYTLTDFSGYSNGTRVLFAAIWARPKVGESTPIGGDVASATAAEPAQNLQVSIFSPNDGDRFTDNEAKIIYELRSPAGVNVDRIEVLVDGEPVGARGMERADETLPLPGSSAGKIVVLLPNKDVTVSLIAHAGSLASPPAEVKLIWGGLAADVLKPNLYALIVGVSRYDDPTLSLKYAAKDAEDFTAALRAQGGGMYGGVDVRMLVDSEATRGGILDGLDWLERSVTSRDIGIVYLAGHGWSDDHGNFWFLSVDATPEKARRFAVGKDEILRTIDSLAGKALFFIDACHAALAASSGSGSQTASRGIVDISAVIRDFANAERSVVGFSSSQGRELSFESDAWGNGAFTKALLEGLAGKADVLDSGQITLSGLDTYVTNRVKELTDGRQHPVMIRPNSVSDFPIALVRDGEPAAPSSRP